MKNLLLTVFNIILIQYETLLCVDISPFTTDTLYVFVRNGTPWRWLRIRVELLFYFSIPQLVWFFCEELAYIYQLQEDVNVIFGSKLCVIKTLGWLTLRKRLTSIRCGMSSQWGHSRTLSWMCITYGRMSLRYFKMVHFSLTRIISTDTPS
jgi:hypothetical protein